METLLKKERLYIAGPMTGYADYNFPAFDFAAKHIRAMGIDVANPAESSRAILREFPTCPTSVFMRVDIYELLNCTGIVLLPEWEMSKNANVEAMVAKAIGLETFTFVPHYAADEGLLVRITLDTKIPYKT